MLLLLSTCSSQGLCLLRVICTIKSGIASLRTTQSRSRMMVSISLRLHLWNGGYTDAKGIDGRREGIHEVDFSLGNVMICEGKD
jgi:hypothetical protein